MLNFNNGYISCTFDTLDISDRFTNLQGLEFLWRKVSSETDFEKFYLVEEKDIDNAVSLFEFSKYNKYRLTDSDYFLYFILYIVRKKPKFGKERANGAKAARLNINQIIQTANSDPLFREKIDYFKFSIKQNHSRYAEHWELHYINQEYCHDRDIAELLSKCTIVIKPSDNFTYDNHLEKLRKIHLFLRNQTYNYILKPQVNSVFVNKPFF